MQHLRIANFVARGEVCHVATTHFRAGERSFLHDHDFFELFLITRGDGAHLINGRDVPVQAGTLVLIRPRDRHGYRTASESGLSLLNIAFTARWFAAFRALWPGAAAMNTWLTAKMPPMCVTSSLAARETLQTLALAATPIPLGAPRHLELTHFCLEAFREFDERFRPAVEAPLPGWLRACLAAMEEPAHAAEPLHFFQRRAGRSPEHFARTCRLLCDAPPTELLNRARIRHAQRMLTAGEAKIIEIAADCGFANLAYFHRTFHRLTGCTPRAWRLRHRNLETIPR